MVMRHLFRPTQVAVSAFLLSCAAATPPIVANRQYPTGTGPVDTLRLPAPFATPSARNNSKVIGWPKGKMPTPAPGFEVSLFAENLDHPRQAYVLPNGDILVVEALASGRAGLIAQKNPGIESLCSGIPIKTANPMSVRFS